MNYRACWFVKQILDSNKYKKFITFPNNWQKGEVKSNIRVAMDVYFFVSCRTVFTGLCDFQ